MLRLLLPQREKFVAIMSEMGNEFESVATKMADAQSLWDATMVGEPKYNSHYQYHIILITVLS